MRSSTESSNAETPLWGFCVITSSHGNRHWVVKDNVDIVRGHIIRIEMIEGNRGDSRLLIVTGPLSNHEPNYQAGHQVAPYPFCGISSAPSCTFIVEALSLRHTF